VFIQLCGIALWSLLQICLICRKQNGRQGDYVRPDRHVQQQLNLNSQFQDSILEDTPLLRDKD